jgi:hypothetical protein
MVDTDKVGCEAMASTYGQWRTCAALLTVAFAGCASQPPDVDATRVCQLVAASSAGGADSALLDTLAQAFRVKPADLRSDASGVFIPQARSFVEERGIYLARPGVVLPGEGSDPSFTRVRECIYKYQVKG